MPGNRYTRETFIAKSKEVHPNKYTYDEVVYVKGSVKVIIGCPLHGNFVQTPQSHLGGQGCFDCSRKSRVISRKLSVKDFVARSTAIHGDKYNYSSVTEFDNVDSKVTLFCNTHQEFFETRPHSHMKGAGCPKCGWLRSGAASLSNTKDFVAKARLVHADKYSYAKTEYVKSNKKVTITCNKHLTDFYQRPNRHLMGDGCPVCADEIRGEKCRKNTEEFIADAKKVHGDKYDYSETEYKTVKDKVLIHCPIHSTFSQCANNHLQGAGCPHCGNKGYRSNKAGIFYVMVSDDITKVGITNKDPEIRAKYISKSSGKPFKVLTSYPFVDGTVPIKLENVLLVELRATYKSPKDRFSGSTECFYDVNQVALLNSIQQLITQFAAEGNQQEFAKAA